MAGAGWAGADKCQLRRTRTSLAPPGPLSFSCSLWPQPAHGQAGVPGKAAANENRLLSLSGNYFIRLRHTLGRARHELEPWPRSLSLHLAMRCGHGAEPGPTEGLIAKKGL